MNFRPHRFSACRKYLSVILLLSVGIIANAQETMITVISHTKGAPSEMKMAELRSVMKGERQRWSDGTKVHIALMKTTTPAGQSACQKVYNMSGDRVKRFWLELSFAGNADPPTFCNTAAELESFVLQNPGAIGITDNFSGNDGIKITEIDGQKSF
ncbi:MAG: hypothetical protein OEV74_00760 [Cyclobacteriaceae bacterium]|nr:hypothetical protein [Cyclobacteriaceae bacterium]MDH4294779.1 hypothetical protein [Cyclobacteriaceae bacterium]MDH5248628.1 hypothetical protein [Cyclobacteriaceae bacterium]